MKRSKTLPIHHAPMCMALSLSLALLGCAEQDDTTATTASSSTTTVTGTGTTTGTTTLTTTGTTTVNTTTSGPSDPSIGDRVGDPITIDHATAHQTMTDNLTGHMDQLETSLGFLEDSRALDNTIELLFGGDDDDEEKSKKKDEPWEIDLSGLRDDLLEVISDRLMVEETATLADDDLSITYAVSAEYFCAEEPEKGESSEDEKERLEDEAECTKRLESNPLQLSAMSDAVGDLNVSVQVGAEAMEVISLQLHDDQISFHLYLEPLDRFLAIFVSPEDFELPTTRAGSLGVEIRLDDISIYTARFAILEDILMEPGKDQDPIALVMSEAADPGRITIDGEAMTLDGYLEVGTVYGSLPWQIVVDMFYDDEGYMEWNEELGYDEWIEPTEPPEVDEAVILDVPGITGTLTYDAVDDAFRLTEMGLGDASTVVMVDEMQIITLDINEKDGRRMDLTLGSPAEKDLGFGFSSDFDMTVTFAWQQVKGAFEELPEFLMDETLGVRMDESDAPQLQILNIEEETQVQMASGRLTLFSSAMMDDVVIEEGECITSVDEETLTEEEREALHDLFGGLMGTACE